MSDNFRVRKAEAVYLHAERAYTRVRGLANTGGATEQDEDDAWLAKQLAALDLEEARKGQDTRNQLLGRADDLFMRIGRVVELGGELEGLLIGWRKDLWALTEDKHESAPR